MGCAVVQLLVAAAAMSVALGQSKIFRDTQNALDSIRERFPTQNKVARPSPSEGYAIFVPFVSCMGLECGSLSGEWNVSYYRRFISPSMLAITFTTVLPSQDIQFISGGIPIAHIYLLLYDVPDSLFASIADFDYQALTPFMLPVTVAYSMTDRVINIFTTVNPYMVKNGETIELTLSIGSTLGGEPCSNFVIESSNRYTFTIYISADNGHAV